MGIKLLVSSYWVMPSVDKLNVVLSCVFNWVLCSHLQKTSP